MRQLSMYYSHCCSAALRMAAWCSTQRYTRRPGQGLVEYGLILVLIMVVCVAVLTAIGQKLNTVWYSKLLPAFN